MEEEEYMWEMIQFNAISLNPFIQLIWQIFTDVPK